MKTDETKKRTFREIWDEDTRTDIDCDDYRNPLRKIVFSGLWAISLIILVGSNFSSCSKKECYGSSIIGKNCVIGRDTMTVVKFKTGMVAPVWIYSGTTGKTVNIKISEFEKLKI